MGNHFPPRKRNIRSEWGSRRKGFLRDLPIAFMLRTVFAQALQRSLRTYSKLKGCHLALFQNKARMKHLADLLRGVQEQREGRFENAPAIQLRSSLASIKRTFGKERSFSPEFSGKSPDLAPVEGQQQQQQQQQLKTTSDVTSKFPWCCRASIL